MRIIVVIAIALWSCQNIVRGQNPQTPVPTDTVITLVRISDAFFLGRDYKVSITADGTVVLQQIKDLKLLPSITTKLPTEKVRELLAEFEGVNFFSLKDKYVKREDGCPEEWTDAGGAEVSITINKRSKTIHHYYGCKQDQGSLVFQLEKRIDEIVGAQQWLK
ncbi:MAG TPA: DUF6438 domain-containing protein [Pyrinomonadaceae bacterium]